MYQIVSISPLRRWHVSTHFVTFFKHKNWRVFLLRYKYPFPPFFFSFLPLYSELLLYKFSFLVTKKLTSSKQWPPKPTTIRLPRSLSHWLTCFLLQMSLEIKNVFHSYPTMKKNFVSTVAPRKIQSHHQILFIPKEKENSDKTLNEEWSCNQDQIRKLVMQGEDIRTPHIHGTPWESLACINEYGWCLFVCCLL